MHINLHFESCVTMRFSRYLLAGFVILGVICLQVIPQIASARQVDEEDEGNTVSVESGVVSSDVQMTGSAIINGEVFIDGEKLPHGTTTYKSKITGKTYFVKRGKNGNVSVTEK